MKPLEPVDTFTCLGRIIPYNNSDLAAVYHNLRNAQRRWGEISKVLTKTIELVHARGILYKEVVEMVLLYGCKSWVVTGAILKILEDFHHQSARRIAGMTARCTEDG